MVLVQHLVAEASEVDKPLLFAQVTVLVALEEEVVNPFVCPQDANLLRLLLTEHNGDLLEEARDHHWVFLEGREVGQRTVVFVTLLKVATVATTVSADVVSRVRLRDI